MWKFLAKLVRDLIGLARQLFAPFFARQESEAMNTSVSARAGTLVEIREKVTGSTGGALDIEEAILSETPDGPSMRVTLRAQRQAGNLKHVYEEAQENVKTENVDPQPLDPDWESRFIDYVRDVSPRGLQKIWARILSGELEKPGRTSLRTLSILRNLSSGDAHAFVELMQYRIDNFIVDDCIKETDWAKHTARLLDAGLLHPMMSVGPSVTTDDAGQNMLGQYGNYCLVIKGPPKTKLDFLTFSSTSLTIAGMELAFLCPINENWEYLSRVAHMLMEKQCSLFAAPVIRDPDGTLKYSAATLKKIEPVT